MKSAPLINAKHEQFCRNMAAGMGVHEAYLAAGYTGKAPAAARLHAKPEVTIRIAALQTETAKRAAITREDIAAQLKKDWEFARKNGHSAAAISASMGLAKLLGMLVDKQEHSGPAGGPIEKIVVEFADAPKKAKAGAKTS